MDLEKEKLIQDNKKMKEMVEDLRKRLFEASQKISTLENEVQSSIRLLWAASYSQLDRTLRIPKMDLERIDEKCQLESGYDPYTKETTFKAIIIQ